MITVQEFAEQNGHSVASVMEMIQNGAINGNEKEGVWYVARQIDSPDSPIVVQLLYLLSLVSLVGGIAMAADSWPNDPGYGYASLSYFRPIAWATAGLAQCALLAAFATAITFLSKIEFNTRNA